MPHPLHNWIPYRLRPADGLCQWLYVFDKSFDEPFFDETIVKCKSHAYNSSPYQAASALGELSALASGIDSLKPDAFIFHISRCGSTMLSQLLGLSEVHISLAEVPLFDEILRAHFKNTQIASALQHEALKAAVSLMGQKRHGAEKHLFVKLDSWHIFFYDAFRVLYPDVPFVFLYRSPDEVLSSHRKHAGMQAVPGVIEPEVFGLTAEQINGLSLDDYTATVLERYLRAFQQRSAGDTNTHLINYKDGIMPMMQQLSTYSGVAFSEELLNAMEGRSRFHSKYPDQPFAETQAPGQASKYLEQAMRAYQELEQQRLNGMAANGYS